MTQDLEIARRNIAVTNVLGLHLRTASKFAQCARAFRSEIRVCCRGIVANGKSVLSLLGLAAECGNVLALEAQGLDAEDAVAVLADLISARFHESDGRGGEPVSSS